MDKFDAKKVTEQLIQGIRDWFERNGKGCNVILGLSGGKDSTIVCKLCVEALGADRVITVGIPDKGQDLHGADEIAKWMGVQFHVVNIGSITDAIKHETYYGGGVRLSEQAEQNIPPRVRMLVLYAISQSNNGRVVGTCNASENYIGYFTKYGDGASDFEPIAELTVHELYQVGDELGIPKKWTYKTPSADLPNTKTDEDEIGFSYKDLDDYIRGTRKIPDDVVDKIEKRRKQNMHKFKEPEHIML